MKKSEKVIKKTSNSFFFIVIVVDNLKENLKYFLMISIKFEENKIYFSKAYIVKSNFQNKYRTHLTKSFQLRKYKIKLDRE